MQLERDVERYEVAAEVRVELSSGLAQDRRLSLRAQPAAAEEHGAQALIGRDEPQRADRAVDDFSCHLENLKRALDVICEIRRPRV